MDGIRKYVWKMKATNEECDDLCINYDQSVFRILCIAHLHVQQDMVYQKLTLISRYLRKGGMSNTGDFL